MPLPDFSTLTDELDTAIDAVDDAKAVVETKQAAAAQVTANYQAALDAANAELLAATQTHATLVAEANEVRARMNETLAVRLGALDTGRVR